MASHPAPSRRRMPSTPARPTPRVAIVGAGMAGASCARALARRGVAVVLFDKSRGVGGRLATRRLDGWAGEGTSVSFDHGAAGFTARGTAFRAFVALAERAGWVARWAPSLAPNSFVALDEVALWVPQPDMPALCRQLIGKLPVVLHRAVDALHHDATGWRLEAGGETLAEGFDHVVLALPPAQAAPLLQAHRPDWARQALHTPMRPCWTLMGLVEADDTPRWDAAWPRWGALAWAGRNDRKPGRQKLPGRTPWVAHATAEWSQAHLDATPEAVSAQLQAQLAECMGHPLRWQHVAVHRWRYASAHRSPATAQPYWHDGARGLGVCGDFLGGAGVEGAWVSGHTLGESLVLLKEAHASAPLAKSLP